MTQSRHRPLRVGLISLGCAKNLVDAEIMLGSLVKGGLEITNEAELADVVIVNTCSFIDAARKESVEAILESAELRARAHPGQGLIVSGCLPQRFRDDLPKLLPEVDAFMGIDQVAQVSEIVEQALAGRREKLRRAASASVTNDSEETPAAHSLAPRSGERARERGSSARKTADPSHEPLAEESASSPRPSPPHSCGGEGVGDQGGSGVQRAKIASGKSLPATESRGSSVKTISDKLAVLEAKAPPPPAAPLVQVHQRPTYIPDYATPRFRLTPRHFAYVKIAEGCNHPCSFCIIPQMRGAHRSRAQDDIVEEARQLIAGGVKELNLISQDTTYYGLDLRPNHSRAISSPEKFTAAARALPAEATRLSTLLRALNALPGDFWIRLLYTHPAHWTDELIETIAQCPKAARYVDMPLQHIHENMLERMRRETSRQYIIDLIARIRAGIPGIALRTTFITGFPGETEAYFESLLDFIEATKFERLGVFTYSPQEGTRAGKMEEQIPERVKKQRQKQAMAAQLKLARQISAACVGREMTVLVEGEARSGDLPSASVSSWEHGLIRSASTPAQASNPRRMMMARSEADAPDIDGRVYVRGKLPIGEFARVRIIGHTDYDLIAAPATPKR